MIIFIDDEIGQISDSDFQDLPPEEQMSLMRSWFNERYEDPQIETPVAEGEFIYPWGGPYNAHDKLFETFGGLVSEEQISELARDLEQEAGDWAPTSKYHERGEEEEPETAVRINAEVGSPEELLLRAPIIERLDQLEALIKSVASSLGPVGHNQPPPEFADDGLAAIQKLSDSVDALRTELTRPSPDVPQAILKRSILSRAIDATLRKFDIFTDELAKQGAKYTLGGAFIYQLNNIAHSLFQHLDVWLAAIGHS